MMHILIMDVTKFFKSLEIIDFTKVPLILAINIERNVLETSVPIIKTISKVKTDTNLGFPIFKRV